VGIRKEASAQAGITLVTFHIPAEAGAVSASIVGEFTGWSPMPMEPAIEGGYEVVVKLQVGVAYRFRYLLDGRRWENEWMADRYVPNDFGGDDSVVDV
jgi:1,4-alpha-glucan branching enzyme